MTAQTPAAHPEPVFPRPARLSASLDLWLRWVAANAAGFAAAGAVPEGAGTARIALSILATIALAGAVVGAIHGAVLVVIVGGEAG